MPTLSPQAQALIAAFGRQPGVSPDQVQNLQDVINGSPALVDQFNAAVAQGHLQRIVPLAHANAGGEYSAKDKEVRLPLAKLSSPPDIGDMTFVLGHELQHGFNAASVKQAGIAFAKDVRAVAKSSGPVHDYTLAMTKLLTENRRDEANAEIAGWNATVGAVRRMHQSPTLGDIFAHSQERMRDFIVENRSTSPATYTLKPGLSLSADMTLSPTPANVEAMGQNYFDKAASVAKLGPRGTSDYVNYYGATLVGYVAEVERNYNPPKPGVTPPRMTFDMAQLRLSEKLLEEKGIDLGKGNPGQQTYYDSGGNPPTAHLFQHTINTHMHTNPVLAQTIEEDRAQTQAAPSRKPSDPDHPDRGLLEKLQGRVRGLDQQAGKGWDENSERLVASALVMAKRMGFTAQDDPQIDFNRKSEKYEAGDLLFVARTGPTASSDPAANYIHMPTAEALSKPLEDRYREVEAINLMQAEAVRVAQQQNVGLDDPSRGGPTR